MNIRELIKKLQTIEFHNGSSTPVLVRGYEAGLNKIDRVEKVVVSEADTSKETWSGEYEDVNLMIPNPDSQKTFVAVHLIGKNNKTGW